jgi:hypothetical protein
MSICQWFDKADQFNWQVFLLTFALINVQQLIGFRPSGSDLRVYRHCLHVDSASWGEFGFRSRKETNFGTQHLETVGEIIVLETCRCRLCVDAN